MKLIEQLKQEIFSLPESNRIAHLEYYRGNQINVLSINANESEPNFLMKSQLLANYGVLLYENGNHSESYDILARVRTLIESNPFNSINLSADTRYRDILFYLGMASYHTKRNSEAKSIFTNLVALDSRNDLYKEWLSGVTADNLSKLDTKLFYGFLAWLVISTVLGYKIPDQYSLAFNVLGILLLLSSVAVAIYTRSNNKK